ncbi:TLC domain-containing protein 1 [Phytophthora pseudosyringae]|uniref:TLC domain-containing protein 1 n=1 Tax=Phytophthora pseudosyringae TaxID=221518 RepID=A0A8T1VTJ8_9STRA|nr:TLC domain-containing protein 1 [Phytophthora pseudosyringae]
MSESPFRQYEHPIGGRDAGTPKNSTLTTEEGAAVSNSQPQRLDQRPTTAMFTEALVATWISMCAVMLYTDPRLSVVVASSLAFAAVRVVLVPLASTKVKAFPALSTFGQLLFSNTAVSMLHSALSSLLAISALLTAHSLNSDFVNTVERGEFLATAVSTGYFAYDLWDYVLNGLYVKSPGIILHHVVVLICYISALTKTVGVPLLSLALVCELHSVFMHARKLLTMSNYSVRQSPLLRWVWRAQWVSFAVARILPHMIVAVLTYQARDLFAQQPHFAMAFGGIIFINLLNAQVCTTSIRLSLVDMNPCWCSPCCILSNRTQLFVDVRRACRKDYAPPKAPPSPAPVSKRPAL